MTYRSTQADLNTLQATQSGALDTPTFISTRELAKGNRKQRRKLKAAIRAGKVKSVGSFLMSVNEGWDMAKLEKRKRHYAECVYQDRNALQHVDYDGEHEHAQDVGAHD